MSSKKATLEIIAAICGIIATFIAILEYCDFKKGPKPEQEKEKTERVESPQDYPDTKAAVEENIEDPSKDSNTFSSKDKTIKPSQPANQVQRAKAKKRSKPYQMKLMVDAKMNKYQEVFLNGKKVKVSGRLPNFITVEVPEINQSYSLTFIKKEDTLVCNPVYFEYNLQKVPVDCKIE